MNRGNWIETFTGGKFYVFDPRPEDMRIEDIAHALSMQPRFAGHSLQFYSVAQHCLRAQELVPNFKLWALLHDAAEAYICDIPRPIKHDKRMKAYRQVERKIKAVIVRAFGLWPERQPKEVTDVDNLLLLNEARQFMRGQGLNWPCMPDETLLEFPEIAPVIPMPQQAAEFAFLETFQRIA
jgi:hypothetical protein